MSETCNVRRRTCDSRVWGSEVEVRVGERPEAVSLLRDINRRNVPTSNLKHSQKVDDNPIYFDYDDTSTQTETRQRATELTSATEPGVRWTDFGDFQSTEASTIKPPAPASRHSCRNVTKV
jgi:hypothetical protein